MPIPPANRLPQIRLQTRHLVLLAALAEHRNLHHAAAALSMTQPAASKQLREVETLLDATLFARLPRGMEPTALGDVVIRHATKALARLASADDELARLKTSLAGQVAIGAIMSASLALLPGVIIRVKQAAPLMSIGVTVDASNLLLAQLMAGNLDFLVARILDTDRAADLHFEALAEEPMCVVARVGHPLQRAAGLQLADLAGAAWVLPPRGSVLRHHSDAMFRRAGLALPGNVIDTHALPLIVPMLVNSDSLYLMPVDVARYHVALGMLGIVPVEVAIRMDAFGIVTRRNDVLSPGAAMVLETLRTAAREIYPP
jgi:DNA-binding transcriptional LysR family regulator